MNYLIVGLGNIGAEYASTRHNMGFMILDAWAQASNVVFETSRYGSTAEISVKGRKFILLKPSTYMNLSGKAVRYWVNELKLPLENLLVISDDLNLPFGTLRMRKNGSAGGHNGLKNIISHLQGSNEFLRVRVGVGDKPENGDLVNHVLGRFSGNETEAISQAMDKAALAAIDLLTQEVGEVMSRYNRKD